jgi:dienelactone hydrolase
MIELLAGVLGPRADDFILAAPSDYQPLNVDSRRSWTAEPRATLRVLRQTFHIDSDRVYVTGFSQGGYAAWSFVTFFGDEIAASIPVACTFDAAPEIPGFWEMLLPNCANVRVLNVWGERDALPVLGLDLKTPRGTNGELNQRLRKLTTDAHMDVEHFVVPRGGHAFEPPRQRMLELLALRRTQYPKTIRHRFRYLSQSRASWIEPLRWAGDQWGLTPHQIEPGAGETNEEALGQMIEDLLGAVEGEIAGQEIRIRTKHVGEMIVWFGDGMIDFDKPIRVIVNDKVLFDGRIDRNLGVYLNETRRTLDFDRLRWAGLRVHSGTATPLTAEDDLPPVVW